MISATPTVTRSSQTARSNAASSGSPSSPGLVVGRPAPRPGHGHEQRRPEHVHALKDGRDAELEHPERPRRHQQPAPRRGRGGR